MYLDDILITGKTDLKHIMTLYKVLSRLEEAGQLRLKSKKGAFMLPAVEYLGHRISAEGLHPTKEKVRAIANAQHPRIYPRRSFLGLLNYYAKLLHLSTILAPLYNLFQKQTWRWGPELEEAFKEAKKQLISTKVLVHYDPQKDLLLACDASPYGVRCPFVFPDGSEKPIAFATRSLSPAERKYA